MAFELFRRSKPDALTQNKRLVRSVFMRHTLPDRGDKYLRYFDTNKIINEIAAIMTAEKRGE